MMIITDTLSNLFSTIKNGYLSSKTKIIQPKSKQSVHILNIFVREGFIRGYKLSSKNLNQLETTVHFLLRLFQANLLLFL